MVHVSGASPQAAGRDLTSGSTRAPGLVILDFGSQYSELIARRVRETEVFSLVLPYTITAEELRALAQRLRDRLAAAVESRSAAYLARHGGSSLAVGAVLFDRGRQVCAQGPLGGGLMQELIVAAEAAVEVAAAVELS